LFITCNPRLKLSLDGYFQPSLERPPPCAAARRANTAAHAASATAHRLI
jgi:hypothetical protein